MRTDPKFRSDGFEIVDDPHFTVFFEDDLEDYCIDDAHLDIDRRLAMWQQVEERLGDQQLRADLGDWDYCDE